MKTLQKQFLVVKKDLMTKVASGELTPTQYNAQFQSSLQQFADKAGMTKASFGFSMLKLK